jgi:hypothetical protein
MARNKADTDDISEDKDLYEATAGWDSYVSGLLRDASEARSASEPRRRPEQHPPAEERRRAPRDRTPARRRSLLMSETGLDPREKRSKD